MLPGTEHHPHARAVLEPALRNPSHAYLFHGPAGSGKSAVARAFAAELLAEGERDPESARRRALDGVHPDLTWVAPSGAHEMLRADVDEPVVGAASHTPFESSRRVFVLERAETMNDEAANRLLKTLEEPPSYVVLVLLTARPIDLLPTIASRCQPVRFDPLPVQAIADRVNDEAAARLCLGDVAKATLLASPEGRELRAAAEGFARGVRAGRGEWKPLMTRARAQGGAARQEVDECWEQERELLPQKERKRRERELGVAAQRAERRASTIALDHGLELAGLWFRDCAAIAAQAPEVIHHVDRLQELQADATDVPFTAWREAVELVEDTRARLPLNVSEELACEALASRLERALAATAAA